MSNIKSSLKHSIKSQNLKKLNNSKRSMLRTFIKKVRIAISKNDPILAKNAWLKLQSILDKLALKNIIHKNKAARYKSRLYYKIKKIC